MEGVSDEGYDKTFIEIMRKSQDKYAIFSFGARGVDPLNYWLIVKHYVPELKPDLVVVCFCGQNDFMPFDRKIIPGLPVLLHGNAGELMSNIPFDMVGTRDSFLYTYKEAYEYYLSQSSLWGKSDNRLLSKICRQSSIFTRVYYKLHKVSPPKFVDKSADGFASMVSYKYLHLIDSLCMYYSIPFKVAFIPQGTTVATGKESNYQLSYKKPLGGIFSQTYFPHDLVYERDYIIPEAHFNVSGNERFARYLLDSVISPQFSK